VAKRRRRERKIPKHRSPGSDRGPRTDQTERRNAVIGDIEARKYAEIIGESVKERVRKFFTMDFLATQMNDHTKGLSERVTVLEGTIGQLRDQCKRAEQVVVFWQKVAGAIYETPSGPCEPDPGFDPKDFGRG
jgi:hypothetical protein